MEGRTRLSPAVIAKQGESHCRSEALKLDERNVAALSAFVIAPGFISPQSGSTPA